MEPKELYSLFLQKPPNSEIKKAYDKWSNAYDELSKELIPEQRLKLEQLYGLSNDLQEMENTANYVEYFYAGIAFMVGIDDNMKQETKDFLKILLNEQ